MTLTLLAPLKSRAVITVGGPDWRSFLQGQLTQDVETLEDGALRFSGLLTPQGRLLYDLFVAATHEGVLLDVAAAHGTAILARLQGDADERIRTAFRVELYDGSDEATTRAAQQALDDLEADLR